jgi:pimeloyl-ACP methyl ester carboxylesterase
VISKLAKKPAVVGHSLGGLLTQIIAGRGLSAASVAVDPPPFRGVLPLPIATLRSALPVLRNPPTEAVQSRCPGISSGTRGPTRSVKRRASNCTRPSTCRAPALRYSNRRRRT